MPSAGDQGEEGSCVAFATTYAARSYHLHRDLGFSTTYADDELFSPEYVYNLAKNQGDCESGMQMIDALTHLKEKGACKWETLPYSDGTCDVTGWDPFIHAKAECFKIDGYERVPYSSINVLKSLLVIGKPILIQVNVDESKFWNTGKEESLFIWKEKVGEWNPNVAHAMVITGWDDSKNAWKVMNSWGVDYGDNGYGWIDYDFLYEALDSEYESSVFAYYMFVLQTTPPAECTYPYSIEPLQNGGNNQTGAINSELALPIKVLVKDNKGAPMEGVKVTFSVLEGSVTIDPVITEDGIAINYWTLGSTPGEQILTVSAYISEESTTQLEGSPITFTANAADVLTNQLKILSTNQIIDFNGLPFYNFNEYDDYCENYRNIVSFNYYDETPGANYIDIAVNSAATIIPDGTYNLTDGECEYRIIDFFHSELFNSDDEYGEIVNGIITVSNDSNIFDITGMLLKVNDETGSQESLGPIIGRIVVQ
jgi:hypothetical protein